MRSSNPGGTDISYTWDQINRLKTVQVYLVWGRDTLTKNPEQKYLFTRDPKN